MAGYSGTPLWKKLGFKPGFRYALFYAPEDFGKRLKGMPADTRLIRSPRTRIDLIVLFARNQVALNRRLARCKKLLTPTGMLWIAWPKKASGLATDLDFNGVQKAGLKLGLVDNKVAAVDEVWSGLRFVYRLKDRKKDRK